MADLTPAQTRVLRFIEEFLAQRGFPPTHAEIARGLGFRSPNAATDHVKRLVERGALVSEPTRSRGLRLLAPSSARRRPALPLIGEVAAGQPILAQENVERQVEVDPTLFRPRADFLLRVRGDSMIEAGIHSGDLAAVHRTPTARDGQIAVVRLDDEVTVKRFRRRAGAILLEPANAALSPLVVDPARVQVAIEGLVVGLLRVGVAA